MKKVPKLTKDLQPGDIVVGDDSYGSFGEFIIDVVPSKEGGFSVKFFICWGVGSGSTYTADSVLSHSIFEVLDDAVEKR